MSFSVIDYHKKIWKHTKNNIAPPFFPISSVFQISTS
jgi:hypothetical protein